MRQQVYTAADPGVPGATSRVLEAPQRRLMGAAEHLTASSMDSSIALTPVVSKSRQRATGTSGTLPEGPATAASYQLLGERGRRKLESFPERGSRHSQWAERVIDDTIHRKQLHLERRKMTGAAT